MAVKPEMSDLSIESMFSPAYDLNFGLRKSEFSILLGLNFDGRSGETGS